MATTINADAVLGVGVDPTEAKRGGQEVIRTLKEIRDAARSMDAQMKKSQRETDRTGRAIGALVAVMKHWKAAIVAVGVAWGSLGIGRFIREATSLAARIEQLDVVVTTIGANLGKSAQEMRGFVEDVRDMGITMEEARQTVTSLAQAQVDLTQASKLARIAQDAAVIGNTNSSDALARLIHGIRTQQVEVLRMIGISVTFERAYAEYAKTIGKTASALSQQERQQAALNAILREGAKITGLYEASMKTANKILGSTARLIEDARTNIGFLFTEGQKRLAAVYYESLKLVNKELEKFKETEDFRRIQMAIKDLAVGFVLLNASMLDFFANFAAAIDRTSTKFRETFIDPLREAVDFFKTGFGPSSTVGKSFASAYKIFLEPWVDLAKRLSMATNSASSRPYRPNDLANVPAHILDREEGSLFGPSGRNPRYFRDTAEAFLAKWEENFSTKFEREVRKQKPSKAVDSAARELAKNLSGLYDELFSSANMADRQAAAFRSGDPDAIRAARIENAVRENAASVKLNLDDPTKRKEAASLHSATLTKLMAGDSESHAKAISALRAELRLEEKINETRFASGPERAAILAYHREKSRLLMDGTTLIDKEIEAQARLAAEVARTRAANEEWASTVRDTANVIGTSFEDAILKGEKLRGVFQGLAQDIARIALRKSATKHLQAGVEKGMDFLIQNLFDRGGIMTDRGAVQLRRYAGGGIARSPQIAMFGEGSTPEAYVPVPNGHIPVEIKGGAGGAASVVNHFAVTVNVEGGGSGAGAQHDAAMIGNEVARQLEGLVVDVIRRQTRPGGILGQGA